MTLQRTVAVTVLVAVALAGCGEPLSGEDPRPDAAPPDQADPPALFLPVTEPDHPDPVVRAGAAGAVVRCDGPVAWGSTASNFGGPPGGATPHDGLALFTQQGLFQVPQEGYREAARDEERVLFVFEAEGQARVAVIVSSVPSEQTMHESGWGIETFAMCDPSEFGLPEDHPLMEGVWTDADGKPAPTSAVFSHPGHEHCDWRRVTFLSVEDEQFVRDPEGKLTDHTLAGFDGDTRLPADAEDTGYRKGAAALWRAPGGQAVYVVTGDRVERWGATRELIACR